MYEKFDEQINVLRAGIEEATDAVNERIEEDGGLTRSAVAVEGGLTRSTVTEEGELTRSAVAQDGNVTREHFDREFQTARKEMRAAIRAGCEETLRKVLSEQRSSQAQEQATYTTEELRELLNEFRAALGTKKDLFGARSTKPAVIHCNSSSSSQGSATCSTSGSSDESLESKLKKEIRRRKEKEIEVFKLKRENENKDKAFNMVANDFEETKRAYTKPRRKPVKSVKPTPTRRSERTLKSTMNTVDRLTEGRVKNAAEAKIKL